jgi:hypothetical protein
LINLTLFADSEQGLRVFHRLGFAYIDFTAKTSSDCISAPFASVPKCFG